MVTFSCCSVIFQVGTDIIYKLSCVQDFKQDMLVTAVKDGLMEVGGRG